MSCHVDMLDFKELLMSRMFPTLSHAKAERRCVTTWPAALKFLSDGALVAMTVSVSLATFDRFGRRFSFSFHQDKGSEIYKVYKNLKQTK